MITLKEKVLVVDDTEKNLQVVGEILHKKDIDIIVSNSPKKAVPLAKKFRPNLILLDIMMPELSGYEVCKLLKSDKDLQDIPVIFLTAKSEQEDILKGFKAGAVDYISKPFSQDELILRVSLHLELATKRESLERYFDIVDKYSLISVTDKEEKIVYASEAFLNRTGYTKKELYGNTHRVLRNKNFANKEFVYNNIKESLQKNSPWEGELLNISKDGTEYWIYAHITPIYSSSGEHIGYQSIMTDITDKKRAEYLSVTDELTKIYNRRKLESIIEYELKKLQRTEGKLSILMIDLDNFKSVNDNFGHEAGDDVLIKFGAILKQVTRETDSAGRWGGEEFLVILPDTEAKGALTIGEKIRKALEDEEFEIGTRTCSIGVYTADKEDSLDTAVKKADTAMYDSKGEGKNRVTLYS